MAESLGTRLGRKFTSAGADREVHLDRKLLHEGKFDKGTWPCLHSIPSTWNEDQYVFSFQAVNMDNCNPDGLTSSMADDIFFVLQKCTRYRSVVPSQMAWGCTSILLGRCLRLSCSQACIWQFECGWRLCNDEPCQVNGVGFYN